MAKTTNLQEFVQDIVNAVGRKTEKTSIKAQDISYEILSIDAVPDNYRLGNLFNPKITIEGESKYGHYTEVVENVTDLTAVSFNPYEYVGSSIVNTKCIVCQYDIHLDRSDRYTVNIVSIADPDYGQNAIKFEYSAYSGSANNFLFGKLYVYWPVTDNRIP